MKCTDAELRDGLKYDPATGIITFVHDYRPAFQGTKLKVAGSRADLAMSKGYRIVCYKGRAMAAHRVAWFLHTGHWPAVCVDHRNLDRSDNRFANLRESTRGQNMVNRRGYSKQGMPKGVHKDSPNRYRAQISCYGRTCRIGTFKTVDEAYAAYCEVAGWVHGEFARVA